MVPGVHAIVFTQDSDAPQSQRTLYIGTDNLAAGRQAGQLIHEAIPGGGTVMLFVGGLRPRHVIGAYEDLGMEVVGTGYEFGHNDDYQRTAQHYVKDGTLIYDDVTGYEFEKFAEKIQPDLVGSGIKEKYVFQKMGIPFRQMHSWDYSGPYHCYDGFAIFARDMDLAVNNPVWSFFKAPWLQGHDAE